MEKSISPKNVTELQGLITSLKDGCKYFEYKNTNKDVAEFLGIEKLPDKNPYALNEKLISYYNIEPFFVFLHQHRAKLSQIIKTIRPNTILSPALKSLTEALTQTEIPPYCTEPNNPTSKNIILGGSGSYGERSLEYWKTPSVLDIPELIQKQAQTFVQLRVAQILNALNYTSMREILNQTQERVD